VQNPKSLPRDLSPIAKPTRVLDLSFDEIEGLMNKKGIFNQDYSEPFLIKELQNAASASLNVSRVRDELMKE